MPRSWAVIGHFRVLLWLCFKTSLRAKMSSACSFIFMQIKVIFIRMVLHLDSLWNRGTRELGNGLLHLQVTTLSLINDYLLAAQNTWNFICHFCFFGISNVSLTALLQWWVIFRLSSSALNTTILNDSRRLLRCTVF